MRKISYHGNINIIKKDFMLYPFGLWKKYFGLGSRGKEVKALQKLLINEGLWEARIGATGFFGPITKKVVIRYQEKYASEILKPLGLIKGTGCVGPSTRTHLEKYLKGE